MARRSPSADPETRTVHVEVDLVDPTRAIPVNTTGEVRIEVGDSIQATVVPLVAASITGTKATLFRIEGDVARKVTFSIQGEQGSNVFLDTALQPGVLVVTEGRATLADGDHVAPREVLLAQLAGAMANAGSFSGTGRLGVEPAGDLTLNLKLTEIQLAALLRAAKVKPDVVLGLAAATASMTASWPHGNDRSGSSKPSLSSLMANTTATSQRAAISADSAGFIPGSNSICAPGRSLRSSANGEEGRR